MEPESPLPHSHRTPTVFLLSSYLNSPHISPLEPKSQMLNSRLRLLKRQQVFGNISRRNINMSIVLHGHSLTLTLLTWTKWWAPTSASKWQMDFNSAFKVLMKDKHLQCLKNFSRIYLYSGPNVFSRKQSHFQLL